MNSNNPSLDERCVDTIRMLAIDAVEAANSGHPGTPMALAPLAYRLFTRHLRHDPSAPQWPDRDRFVLSCGHASMLLYATLHLTGYDVSLDQLKQFRQLGSPTEGHPEWGKLDGIETTTGPLGQGLANAVGMALAERMLADRFGSDLVDHFTYVLASDGDLMEGVQAEACSLAGHLQLGRLIVFFDDNKITIDGSTELTFTEDVGARFAAYGWQVLAIDDVEDAEQIDAAVTAAKSDSRPTLVVTRTHIGIGSPLQDTAKAHGAPLGADNVKKTRQHYGWPEQTFFVDDDIRDRIRELVAERATHHASWEERRSATDSTTLAQFDRWLDRSMPTNWHESLRDLSFDAASLATRQASGAAINAIAPALDNLVGGSADLAESNLTEIKDGGVVAPGAYGGRNIRYGVREHAMAAISNGLLLHGGLRPFCATFLIFSDYMRPSIRLASLMGLPTLFVFTHDSVGLGEDGPTHQPVEQLASLRALPNLLVFRPADAYETAQTWEMALTQRDRPSAMCLSRQKLPVLQTTDGLSAPKVERGAYVLRDCEGEPDVILIGTGSEVHVCLQAHSQLNDLRCRVVSMPCAELFAEQSVDYRESVLPSSVGARVSVEAATTFGWERWVGEAGHSIGLDRFGASGPGEAVLAHFGFTADNVASVARDCAGRVATVG